MELWLKNRFTKSLPGKSLKIFNLLAKIESKIRDFATIFLERMERIKDSQRSEALLLPSKTCSVLLSENIFLNFIFKIINF